MLRVTDIVGLPGVPSTNRGARGWLKSKNVPLREQTNYFTFALSDLPSEVQRALLEREAEREGLELGERDEDAHARFAEATPKMQVKAERLAQIARFIVARRGLGIPNREIFEAARARFGAEDTSDRSCYRILKDIKGVAVANFAPALLDPYNMDGRPCGPSWDDAWYFALAEIKAAGPEWPLDAAYDNIVASAPKMGWHVPCRSTFNARWQALSEVERFTLRHGEEAARKRFRQSVLRDRDDLPANDIWSLDGRTLDVWAMDEDGNAYRPVELRLVDVASGFVLGSRLCKSENAVDTVALIVGCVRQWGKPKEIYTDNGRAFASFIVAGGATFKFRGKKDRKPEWEPPGACKVLGINIRFAKPENGRTKLVERSFRETSRRIDQAPEFAGAHAGSRIDRKPAGKIVPLALEAIEEVSAREVAYHNARKRRGGFAKGRSFEAVYLDSMAGQIKRVASERELYEASLIYKPVSVNHEGRFTVNGWTYGHPETMVALLRFYDVARGKAREPIMVGIDPNDHSAPAVAYDRNGNPIAKDIRPVIPGAYMSQEGKRDHDRYTKAANDLAKQAGELGRKASAAAVAKGRAAYAKNTPTAPVTTPSTVVQPQFNGALKAKPKPEADAVPAEYIANMDRWHARMESGSK